MPVTKISSASESSSGMIIRSTVSILRALAISMTVRLVIPSRKQSAVGVCRLPSITRKIFAPVASARRPRQSSIRASSKPAASASCLLNVQIMYNPAAFVLAGMVSGDGRFHLDHCRRIPFNRASGVK